MASQQILLDGNFTRGLFVNSPVIRYPFQVNNDKTAITIDRQYRVRGSTWIPGQVGVDRDPRFSDAYLMAEPEPTPTGISDLVAMTRTYARIPATQTTYSTRVITKPTAQSIGGTVANLADYTALVYSATTTSGAYAVGAYFSGDNRVFTASTAISPTIDYATGGTFTLTYKTSTTGAISYVASNATIQTAVNALADVVTDGVTFTAINNIWNPGIGYLVLVASSGSPTANFTANGASLTPTTATTLYVLNTSITTTSIYVSRQATITAHGLSGSESIFLRGSVGGYYIPGNATAWWKVIDANTISFSSAIAFPTYFGLYLRTYTPGTDRVGIRLSQRFYLPGVTSGIATAGDIPIPDLLLNDENFLTAVVAYSSGYQNYDATELVRWNGWPIYTQTFQEINMADV